MKALALTTLACALAWLAPATAQTMALDSPVPFEEYAQWPADRQVAYDREMRSAFYEFEIGSHEKMEFAGAPGLNLWPEFLPKAFAASDRACLIGGIRRAMVPSGDRYVCPTVGRGCKPHGDAGFLCGTIYNDACITREPRDTISKRCLEAAGDAPVDEGRYNAKREAIQSIAADCRSGAIDQRYKTQCQRFLSRMSKANSAPEKLPDTQSTASVRTTPENIPLPKRKPRGPPAEVQNDEPPATGDCLTRNRAKLGALACVACGMENASPAEIRNHGKGVSKWVALLGVMAQKHYGPFNVKDDLSRKAYQQRVAEMVASYGYCTDREYPITPANNTRDLIDGKPLKGRELQFAQNFGLMSTVRGMFSGEIENKNDPLKYANKIFDDSHPRYGWNAGNVQNRQWRFRSMLHAHRKSYGRSAFSQCANSVESRLSNSARFKMCPIREGTWSSGALRLVYPQKVTDTEMANNQAFYDSMATSCGLPQKRRMPNNNCDHNCWGNRNTFPHATSHLRYCDVDGRNSDKSRNGDGKDRDPTPPGERGEDSTPRGGHDDPGKGGEESSGRDKGGGVQ